MQADNLKNSPHNAGQQHKISLPPKKSLKFRLTAIVILISLFWSGATLAIVLYIYQNRIEAEYIRNALAISRIIASMVDGEDIDRYLLTMEKDEYYERVLEFMRIKKRETDAMFIYISRNVEGGEIFVFDADEDTEWQMGLGEFKPWTEEDYDMTLLPYLIRGERVEPELFNTAEFGWLLTVREPIFRSDGTVAAFANVDISMARTMQERRSVFTMLMILVVFILSVAVAVTLFVIEKNVISPVRALMQAVSTYRPDAIMPDSSETPGLKQRFSSGNEIEILRQAILDMETRIESAEEFTKLMLDSSPFCCQLWDDKFRRIDCNEATIKLFGFKDKQEHLANSQNLYPEYQPNGMRSYEMGAEYITKAFKEGFCAFDWTYKMLDGSLMPAEVTLVRVSYKDRYLVVEHTRDLREIVNMENKINHLEVEADKIYYDALTGIYNRRYFDEKLEHWIKSISHYGGTLSLMMIDIDRFKQYNDTYGHSAGDDCLKIVAEILTNTVTRADDFTVRYGGEEFTAVLPNTSESGARMLAEKLLENIRNRGIPHEQSDVADFVTVSIGVITGVAGHGKSGADYIKKADEMLYKSKQSGRNMYTAGSF